MATVEVLSGERPYYTVRVTVADGRAYDQPVFVEQEPADVPAALAGYAADMEAQLPPPDPEDAS